MELSPSTPIMVKMITIMDTMRNINTTMKLFLLVISVKEMMRILALEL